MVFTAEFGSVSDRFSITYVPSSQLEPLPCIEVMEVMGKYISQVAL